MTLFKKHFTIEEARAWLPELRQRFEMIHARYQELAILRDDYERVMRVIHANGHASKLPPLTDCLAGLQRQVQAIVEAGIEIKDVGRGLVDFPHFRDGDEVFLCWELGEDDINFWHTIEEGYMGRQPL